MSIKPRNGPKLNITPPEEPIEYWWEPGNSSPASIGEDRVLSDYDCGYLDLGAETPSTYLMPVVEHWAGSGLATPYIRRSPATNKPSRFNKYAVDRDCGICFEYAVVPCKTLCCEKLFCTEHLADWLHGPEAEGRCPNCQNPCSLAAGTLSLASPPLISSARGKSDTSIRAIQRPPTLVQQHSSQTLTSLRDRLYPQAAARSAETPSASPSSTCSSTVAYSDSTVSTEEPKTIEQCHINTRTFSQENIGTSSLSPLWGILSRIVSILIFLIILYKLWS